MLIADDVDYYRRCREVFLKPPEMPNVYNTPVKWGCPYDCGLCTDHEQHSCLTLIEITDFCNLDRAVDSAGDTIDFLLSPKRDLTAAKLFLRLALSGTGGIRPRVINVDGHPAYARAIAELKQSGDLGRCCRCRPSPYLNNIIEQDHRFIKKRIAASLWFRSAEGASRTIDGYEAMHLIRKGQIRWLPKGDVVGQRRFIHTLFGIAA